MLCYKFPKDCLNELLTWKNNLLQLCCMTVQKILVVVPAQSIFLILLRAMVDEVLLQISSWIQALEYRHQWWSPLLDKQLAFFTYQLLYALRHNDAKNMTAPPPPFYLHHFQIFKKSIVFQQKCERLQDKIKVNFILVNCLFYD